MAEKQKTIPSKQNDTVSFFGTPTPAKREMRLTVPEQNQNYVTEFRNYEDGAWYTVMVTLEEKETLRVRYEKFTDEEDNIFEPSFFESLEELVEFEKRFRPLSVQVQDYECRKLVKGVRVCASLHFTPDDLRFYDAVVDAVEERKHSRKKDAECLCTFILSWLHGPNEGKLTAAEIGDICIVQPIKEHDPAVAFFLEITRRRLESQSGQELVVNCHKGTKTKTKMGFFERMQKGKRRAKRSVVGACSPEVSLDESMEDKELEGKRNVCMILIGNLDKELCPSTAVEFIYKHTQVSASVFIFPSLSLELYTRGAIMLHTEQDFQKLCDFLTNPNYIIASSTGRPWVVIEKQVGLKNIKASIGTLFPKSENASHDGNSRTSSNLKVVHSGTQEFKTASAKRDLFSEFADHQVRLHKKLAFLEASIHEI
ncbi:putative SAWADEE domain-containing protein [Medicago truncatula]|uniref:Putative SAWADEE domain-containing protein n=1 Tax=Medicago truncatula TaxID=3880 RepID=A0A396IWM7_MEDTR|nr:uncharacterized protein LOC11442208 [Medicago truncatula]RHN69071.1 putative SAWADEE domain-containing protein [Medicago truncatula]